MILPNCIWSAGRTAEVIRKTAVSCLWTLLSEKLLSRNQVFSMESGVFILPHDFRPEFIVFLIMFIQLLSVTENKLVL